jgi:hypothetical protein
MQTGKIQRLLNTTHVLFTALPVETRLSEEQIHSNVVRVNVQYSPIIYRLTECKMDGQLISFVNFIC